MAIDPKTTALVLIEYQNDFTTEGGVLHGAVSEVMDKTGMLANTLEVVDAARAAGATVMHAPISFAEGYNEISSHPYGILKGVVDGKAFYIIDSHCAQARCHIIDRKFKEKTRIKTPETTEDLAV